MATALREIFARFVVDFDKKGSLRKGETAVRRTTAGMNRSVAVADKLSRSFRNLGIAIGGAAILGAVNRFIGTTIRMGDELDKVSQQVGLTAQELQAYTHAANLAGVDSQGFANAMGQLQKNARDMANGTGEAKEAFEQLGVEVTGTNGELLSGGELLQQIADGFQNTSNPAERTALAMEIMGRSGRRMLPMLTGGSEGLQRMTEELEALGGGMSDVAIRNSVELTDSLTRLNVSWTSMRSQLAVRVLPTLDWLVRKITAATVAIGGITEDTDLFAVAIAAAGTAAAIAAALTISSWGPVAAVVLGIGLVVLAIEDLVGTAKGADSVTKRLLESLLGVEGARPVLADIRDLFEGMSLAAKDFSEAVLDIISLISSSDVLDVMAGLVNPALGVVRAIEAVGRGPEQIETGVRGIGVTGRAVTGVRGAGATANAKALARERESVRLRMLASGADSVRASAAAASITQTVDARMDVNVSVAEATDAQEVDRRVRVAIRDAQDRQARQLQAALVREGGTGT